MCGMSTGNWFYHFSPQLPSQISFLHCWLGLFWVSWQVTNQDVVKADEQYLCKALLRSHQPWKRQAFFLSYRAMGFKLQILYAQVCWPILPAMIIWHFVLLFEIWAVHDPDFSNNLFDSSGQNQTQNARRMLSSPSMLQCMANVISSSISHTLWILAKDKIDCWITLWCMIKLIFVSQKVFFLARSVSMSLLSQSLITCVLPLVGRLQSLSIKTPRRPVAPLFWYFSCEWFDATLCSCLCF